jgi:NAD(P)-dependent dehydrogenase (short-subunit alcohol dehydrogenase family)
MACPYAKTEDGIESQFGTNHIGHFLLTKLLANKILAAGAGSRIVNVSSSAIRGSIRYDDYNFQARRVF